MKKLIFALAPLSLLVPCGEKDNSGSGGYSILLETLEATEVGPAGAKLNAKLDLKDVRFASLACGYYWSSSLRTDYPVDAWYVYIDFDTAYVSRNSYDRCNGQSVRPVSE